MIARAARAASEAVDGGDASWEHVAESALRAAFDGVPMSNYAIGTLLQSFDHVICLKGSGAAVFVPNGEADGFDSIPHRRNYVYRKDGSLSAIQFTKLGDPDA